MPSVIVSTEPIKNATIQLVKRGIRPRFITEITKENISYCKELVKMGMEIRHLDNAKSNFAIGKSDYIANASQSANAPLPQLIHSNVKAVIEQQQYLFENLWHRAIPAFQLYSAYDSETLSITFEASESLKNLDPMSI